MIRYTLDVEGMQCGMCESHVNDAIRRAFHVKKVESSHGKHQTIILTEEPLDEAALRRTIDGTGYTVRTVKSEPYEKRGWFSPWKKGTL